MDGEFSFDFKGYDFGKIVDLVLVGDEDMLAEDDYALIYYVDPKPEVEGWEPDVYVLGISEDPYDLIAKGKAKGLVDVDIKICGSCDSGQIPVVDDVSYPNGGKIWLVPVGLLDSQEPCTWTTMTGWGTDILFETSLITYGFVEE